VRAGALSLAAVVVVLGGACGRKSPPVAPETVRPRAPATLTATSTPEGVRLTWLRPLTYTGGQRMHDLDRFLIERAPGEGASPTFVRVATVVLEDRFRFRKERRLDWLDHDVKPGDRYLYRVIAVTRDGSRSGPAGPVVIRYEASKGVP